MSVFMVAECGISMDSLGGVALSSIMVSISLLITLCSLINESSESPADSKPVITQTSVPDGFLMVVWSVKMKTWDTVAIQGKIMEGRISTGKKVYFYRSNQMIVADKDMMLIISGTGEVIEPESGICAIGSGGNYALSAARALAENTDMDAETIVRKAMKIAGDLCVFTNHHLTVELV